MKDFNGLKNCLFCKVEFNSFQYNKVFCCKKCQRLSKLSVKLEHQKKYYKENIEKRQLYTINNKIKIAESNAKWYINNISEAKDKIKNREKKYLKNNVNYLIAKRLRTRLYCAIKNNQKVGSAIKDLGCSVEELKVHLESKFQLGMTWDNYGEWHIDHIKPLANYDLTNRIIFLELNHYTNLQPLWAEDNLQKKNKE